MISAIRMSPIPRALTFSAYRPVSPRLTSPADTYAVTAQPARPVTFGAEPVDGTKLYQEVKAFLSDRTLNQPGLVEVPTTRVFSDFNPITERIAGNLINDIDTGLVPCIPVNLFMAMAILRLYGHLGDNRPRSVSIAALQKPYPELYKVLSTTDPEQKNDSFLALNQVIDRLSAFQHNEAVPKMGSGDWAIIRYVLTALNEKKLNFNPETQEIVLIPKLRHVHYKFFTNT